MPDRQGGVIQGAQREEGSARRRGSADAAARSSAPPTILALQRLAGNRAVAGLLRPPPSSELPAVQRKPDHHRPTGGAVEMEPMVIDVPKERRDGITQRRAIAHKAIMDEVDRAVHAVEEGHELGLDAFSAWYMQYEKAKEDANSQITAKIFGFLLDVGLDIVFPEEEILYTVIKKVATKAFEKAVDKIGEVRSGDVPQFLANLRYKEQLAIVQMLDYHATFEREHKDVLDEAIMEYGIAQDNGWSPDADGDVPSGARTVLRRAGVGAYGSAAATVFAERWLSAHIQAVYRENEALVTSVRGEGDVRVLAEIAALRTLGTNNQNLERIFKLEASLDPMFRTISDVNESSAIMLHIRLGLDNDDAAAIVASREKDGLFETPHDLVTRKLITDRTYERLERQMVAH